jgi:hypothetical protein
MLDNDPVFNEITLDHATLELERLNRLLRTMPIGNAPQAQKEFLQDAFRHDAEMVVFPNIHGIPKIHKQPLKIRPIVH